MKKLIKNIFYTINEYPFSEVGDITLEGEFDVQLYIELFNSQKKKIGDAAFCYLKDKQDIWFCDYFYYGIEIDKKYQKCGLGTEIVKLALKHSKKRLVLSPNHEESTAAGKALIKKFI